MESTRLTASNYPHRLLHANKALSNSRTALPVMAEARFGEETAKPQKPAEGKSSLFSKLFGGVRSILQGLFNLLRNILTFPFKLFGKNKAEKDTAAQTTAQTSATVSGTDQNTTNEEEKRAFEALEVKPGDKVFQTSKGSVYKFIGDGTKRYKAEGIAKAHGEEPGLREASTRTIFVNSDVSKKLLELFFTPEQADKGIFPNAQKNGYNVYSYEDAQNPKLIYSFDKFSTEPKVGLNTVELWYSDKGNYKQIHVGHEVSRIFKT
jgi:hypothetical protein